MEPGPVPRVAGPWVRPCMKLSSRANRCRHGSVKPDGGIHRMEKLVVVVHQYMACPGSGQDSSSA